MQKVLPMKAGVLAPFTELQLVPRCVAVEICDTRILTDAL